jgi:predicted deacetylase
MSAQYLVRFDDICPTMNWSIWERVEEKLVGAGIKPILAVVPDNQDPTLRAAKPNMDFWDRVRAWQMRGWTIGLHGYQHVYSTRNGGILQFNQFSEFSGLTFNEQISKLQRARDILKRERVHPELWVAPAHSFDVITLRALNEIGIRYLSDGFSLYPYRDSTGIMWVPQQLWHFRKMPFGIWTVCLHLNRWTLTDVDRFHSNLQEFGAVLTDWRSVVSQYEGRRRSPVDYLFSKTYPTAQRARYRLAQIRLQ